MTISKSTDQLTSYERWQLPRVSGKTVSSTAQELETIQKQAYDEGFAFGQKEGHEQKQNELDSHINTFRSMIELLSEPLKELDDSVVQQLAELAMTVAKQVVRRELHTEEGEIVGIVREAMTALPASTRKVNLNIHPDDAELVRSAFSFGEGDNNDELRWAIIEDPMLTRGGCRISSENSGIDATVEGRLNRIITTMLGGERDSDE